MDILITGGAGFIGSVTTDLLIERGHQVTVLDSFSTQIHGHAADRAARWSAAHPAATLLEGDVRDRVLLDRLVPAADAVLHLAAETGTGQSMYDIAHYTDVNVMGTAHLLEAVSARAHSRVRTLVIASSRSIYGEGRYACAHDGDVYPTARLSRDMTAGRFDPRCPLCGGDIAVRATHEGSQLQPASVYAVTKLAQENMVLAVARARGLSAYALRYQNVYGAGQSLNNPYTGILSIFSREMLAGRPVEIFEDGLESRDFVHVRDVAWANVQALEAEGGNVEIVNIGSGGPTGVLDIAHRLATTYGFNGSISISGRFRAGDIRHNYADITRSIAVFGIGPTITLDAGLAEFAQWVRASVGSIGNLPDAYRSSLAALESRGLISSAASE